MKRKYQYGSSLLLVAALVAAGCGSDKGGTQPAGSSASPTTKAPSTTAAGNSTVTTKPAGKSAEGISVAFIPHFRSPFTQIMIDGAQAAVGEFPGAKLVVAGPTGFDAPAAIAALDDAVASGVQGAAVVPFPAEVWTKPLKEHIAKGLVVATLNVPALDSGAPLYVGVNEFSIGSGIADVAIGTLGANPTGPVVLGNCAPGVQVLSDRIDGFNAEVAKRAPGLKVAKAIDVGAEPTANLGAWEAAVAANPDAVAFAGFCAFDTPNLVRVKEKKGGKFVIAGGDLEPDTLKGIKDGSITASVSQSPFMQGYVAVRAILEKLVNGTPMPNGWIDAGIETVDSKTIDAVTARETDPTKMKASYQKAIDKIFADSAAAAQPTDKLRG